MRVGKFVIRVFIENVYFFIVLLLVEIFERFIMSLDKYYMSYISLK